MYDVDKNKSRTRNQIKVLFNWLKSLQLFLDKEPSTILYNIFIFPPVQKSA